MTIEELQSKITSNVAGEIKFSVELADYPTTAEAAAAYADKTTATTSADAVALAMWL